jgi:hypothetical protein
VGAAGGKRDEHAGSVGGNCSISKGNQKGHGFAVALG